ncbi:MAG: MOSC domain-containing protein [Burkholderiales bacterium]|nr:MOSC domain-containing protein [Burkholderiales bacterium]
MPTIHDLYRYPVKGLSPEPLKSVAVNAGEALPGDRSFAITNGTWKFDPTSLTPHPKTDFCMLALHEKLATLSTRYDDATGTLSVAGVDGPTFQASLKTPEGRAKIAAFVGKLLEIDGTPELVEAPGGHRFTDVSVVSASMMQAVSLVNLASVKALEDWLGVPVHPLRFRANLYFDGGKAWEEFDWMGGDLRIGDAIVRPVLRTQRCAATNVDPETADRDLEVPGALRAAFGHPDMGIYVEIVKGGTWRIGDTIAPA